MEHLEFIQSIRIIHALARIAIELESKEAYEPSVVRSLSVIEDAYLKSGGNSPAPAIYTFVFPGSDDEITVSIAVSVDKFQGEDEPPPPYFYP